MSSHNTGQHLIMPPDISGVDVLISSQSPYRIAMQKYNLMFITFLIFEPAIHIRC